MIQFLIDYTWFAVIGWYLGVGLGYLTRVYRGEK